MTYRFRRLLIQITCGLAPVVILVTVQGQMIATGSFAQAATDTATATQPSLTPSITLTPSLTFTPTPSCAFVVPMRELPVRGGPGLQYGVIGTVEAGVALPFYVMSDDGNWVLLSQPGEPGRWLGLSPFVRLEGEWNEIIVAGASPTPTATWTPTSTPTLTNTPIPTVDVDAIAATAESAVLATLAAQGIDNPP